MIGRITAVLLVFVFGSPSAAEPTKIAVAANFAKTAEALVQSFNDANTGSIELVIGSTGALYLQITQGAPVEALLAADSVRPKRLEAEGLTIKGSRFTYALGRLVLFTRNNTKPNNLTLRSASFERLAIANPSTAPYGSAAIEAISALGVMPNLSDKLVRGKSVTQAFQFAWSGTAEYALVSEAQALLSTEGNFWRLPQSLYKPITQDAVLIANASPRAIAFLNFLKSPKAQSIISQRGYDLETERP